MTRSQEKELLELSRENNALLRAILRFVHRDESNDFATNIFANIIGNRLDGEVDMEYKEIKIPRWITNISFFLSLFYVTRKTKGFKSALKVLLASIKVESYLYMYNNWSWFKNRVLKNVRKSNPELEPLTDIIFSYNPTVDLLNDAIVKLSTTFEKHKLNNNGTLRSN